MTARGVDFTGVAYLVALGIVAYGAYKAYGLVKAGPKAAEEFGAAVKKAITDAAAAVGPALNPANPGNVVNRGANAIVGTVVGSAAAAPGASDAERAAAAADPIGFYTTRLWEFFNPSKAAAERALFAPSPGYNFASTTTADNDDAEQGRAMLAQLDASAAWRAGGNSTADRDDAELGAAMQRTGASAPMTVSDSFSYLTRIGRSF